MNFLLVPAHILSKIGESHLLRLRDMTPLLNENRCFHLPSSLLKFRFIYRENPRRSGISLFSDRLWLSRLMKTGNRRHPRLSGMVADKLGKSGLSPFSRRVPDFCYGWRSFPTYENSNLYCRGRRRLPLNCFFPVQFPTSPPPPPYPTPTNKIGVCHRWTPQIWDRRLAISRYLGKIWDGRTETVKSLIVRDFPDVWTCNAVCLSFLAASCQDTGWFCWIHKNTGRCVQSSDYAVNKCKKTCNFCPVPTGKQWKARSQTYK